MLASLTPVLTAQVRDRHSGLVLLQDADDLLFREAAAPHVLVLSLGQNELQTGLGTRGNVTMSDPVRRFAADVRAKVQKGQRNKGLHRMASKTPACSPSRRMAMVRI
jgi:hypothetical protein